MYKNTNNVIYFICRLFFDDAFYCFQGWNVFHLFIFLKTVFELIMILAYLSFCFQFHFIELCTTLLVMFMGMLPY